MKKLLLISAIASLAAFCSCSNEDENLGANQVYDKVVATIESDGSSRTTMNGTYVNWVKDDQIGIFFQGGDNKAYTLDGDGGSTSGEFGVEALIEEGAVKVLAYYPYSSTATYESEVLNINLEAEHTYSATSNNGFPMIAKIAADSQNKIQFKNAGAILAVTVKNLPTEYTYVTLSAADNDSKIAGKAKIAYDGEGQPKLEIVEDGGNSSTIKIKLAENRTEVIEECTFYFPLPVANYSKLTFSLHKSESDEPVVGKEKALNAARNMRYNATLVFDKVSTDIVTETTSTSAATEALSNGAYSVQVSVTADENNPTITLPSSDEGASVNLYFDKIEATTAITIAETSDATTNAAVTIAAPESDGETNNNNFNIVLPNLTVTLAANGESATYNEVTASTAENTLIISEGVTVKTLKVKKGHVRVHGKIEGLSRVDNSDEVTYVICEDGAEIPLSLEEGIVNVSAAEWNLIAKFKSGGTQTITLNGNVEITQPLTLDDKNANITVDLGTYSLTNKTAYDYDDCGKTECYVFEVKAGTLNITGTTGSVNAVGGSDYDMAVFANTDGKVNISGGKFTNKGKENDGCDLIYARDNAVVTISGGEFEAGNKSSDVGNQYVALNLKDNSNASITVTGGKFHKFNPAYNVSENPKKNFAGNNTMVAVSGTEGSEVYEVIDLSKGYTMTSDIEIATPITIDTTEEIAFNLGTFSLTNNTSYDYDNCGKTECYVFEVKDGTLNISGSGSVNAVGGSSYDMVVFANNNGKVVINGGTYKNKGQTDKGCDVIYAKNAAVVEIHAGTFEAGNANKESFANKTDGVYAALNLHGSATGSINVYGGTFVKFDPANPGTESASWNASHTNGFVADGYTSAQSGDNYVVSKDASDE